MMINKIFLNVYENKEFTVKTYLQYELNGKFLFKNQI